MLACKKNKKRGGDIDFDLDEVADTASALLLAVLSVGSVVLSGSIQPGLVSLLGKSRRSKKYTQAQVKNAFYNSKKRKLIEIVRISDDVIEVRLTNKGRHRMKEFSFNALRIEKPRHWDKKWRMLIFDIPTKPAIYNQARNALRGKIKELGFYQLQKSVWVYPYECEDEILLIAELYRVQKHIEIITAEKVLHEDLLKKHFTLS